MKTVVTSEMVAHLWANQSQSTARNARNSFFFRDSTIWSYGAHFPIARHVAPDTILFTTRTYSNTTCKHLLHTRRAIASHKTVLHVHNVLANNRIDHLANLKDLQANFIKTLDTASRARTYFDLHMEAAKRLVETHNTYREFFRVEEGTEALTLSPEWREGAKRRRAAHAELMKEQAEIEARYALENMRAWVQGLPMPHAHRGTDNFPETCIRLKDAETIETSRGAEVPVTHARELWGWIHAIHNGEREPYYHNGHSLHVGSFRVDSISKDGTVKAGCHTLKYDMLKAFADRMNWHVPTAGQEALELVEV